MSLIDGEKIKQWRPHWRERYGWVLYHRIKQWFVKPTCNYCTLAERPQYGERCEICDEWDNK